MKARRRPNQKSQLAATTSGLTVTGSFRSVKHVQLGFSVKLAEVTWVTIYRAADGTTTACGPTAPNRRPSAGSAARLGDI